MRAAKSADLCWGQRHHWLRYQQVPPGFRHDSHITDTITLPDGVTTQRLRTVLDHLVRRHEGLRTVVDAAAWPWPRQVVHAPGPLVVREATTEPDGTPPPVDVIAAMTAADFDTARDWPIRACVVTTGGMPRRLHLVFNHLAFDDVSLPALRREFRALLSAVTLGRPASLPPVAHQPVDLARHEAAGPTATAATAHWREQIGRLPADMFVRRRRADADPTVAHSASLTAPALLGSATSAADRWRVWPSAVHLAAYAVTMAAYTGERRIAHRMYTGQRGTGGFADTMTCMSAPTPVILDLSDDPLFGEVTRRAAEQVEQSRRFAHVPYDEIVEAVATEGARRARAVRVESDLNFLSNAPRSCGTRRERFTRNAAPAVWARAGADTYLRVYEWSDGLTLMLQAADPVLDADAVEGFLRGYAGLLDAHRDPAVELRVGEAAQRMSFAPPSPRPLVLVGPDAVDTEQTAAAVATHPAVASARVRLDGTDLVADVVAHREIDAGALRTHCLGAVHDRPGARCPDRIRITVVSDDRPDDRPDAGPDPARADVLAQVVAEVNGLTTVDPSLCYTAAGGRALRMPLVLAVLADRGWSGIRWEHLLSGRPLSTLRRDESDDPLRHTPTTTEGSET